ncbi:hypothetical protein N7474_010350 [Penicillium riverlandense]|uniref:uncharacterized protein n=1 Tax=Penicillium riverlandense TaxID=1903569 RepID=UPI002548E772|nr:uncharacterized protein N7474_010350 [Penicillium riverlandense]KAJ5806758.1 hypothetical protein N7474_010350 [Penicillium riverlandense]
MPDPSISFSIQKHRKRRFHTKSRQGCGNCKLRRVKCDETRPQCQKCHSFGVWCNYAMTNQSTSLALELEAPAPVSSDGVRDLRLDRHDVRRLAGFQQRQTVLTIVNVFQEDVLRLALVNPYLMHTVLAMSAMHDRYLHTPSPGVPSTFEVYHSAQCASLLNQKLSQPISPQDRDPLWMAVTFLGIITFSSLDTSHPSHAWPLRAADPSDLEWMRMAETKMAVMSLAEPRRVDSLFRAMAGEYSTMFDPVSSSAGATPSSLARVCLLKETSSKENNPYFTAVRTLAPLLGRRGKVTRSMVLAFSSQMEPVFKMLLRQKDPVALLLLAMWYDKAAQIIWWVRHRANVECRAICLYLQREHGKDREILDMLPILS